MDTFNISQADIRELKQTMGFRVNQVEWASFADAHPDGCTNVDLVEFVKSRMNPAYEVPGSLDEYLYGILSLFLEFIHS